MFKIIRYVLLLIALAVIARYDFPDRFAAERRGARPATVSEYRETPSRKRPWAVVIVADDGRTIENPNRWRFRWLQVGTRTEWTENGDQIYIGGFFLRWSAYLASASVVLILVILGLRKLHQGQNEA